MNFRKFADIFLQLLKDPGILFAVANGLLFLKNSFISFLITIFVLVLSMALKIFYKIHSLPSYPLTRLLYLIGGKKFIGLEMMGYACLAVAFISMTQQHFINFICSFCFGLANLLMAINLASNSCEVKVNLRNTFKQMKETLSLTPFVLSFLHEPIFLICIGFLFDGISAGEEALWILPLICIVPYLTICKSHLNRAIPLACLCLCIFWFTVVSLYQGVWTLFVANVLFLTAYVEITLQEYNNSQKL